MGLSAYRSTNPLAAFGPHGRSRVREAAEFGRDTAVYDAVSEARRFDPTATGSNSRSGLFRLGDAMGCAPGPGHELVDAGGGPEVDELGEHVGEIGLRVDVVELAALDQRGDASPVRGSLVVPGEECILAIEYNRPFILPVSGLRSRFTIVFRPVPRCNAAAGAGRTARNRKPEIAFISPRRIFPSIGLLTRPEPEREPDPSQARATAFRRSSSGPP